MHPAEYHIRFLLARSWAEVDETHETINLALKVLDLPDVTEEVFSVIHGSFRPPRAFYFKNTRHRATAKFMREQKIFSLWKPTEEDKEAVHLLGQPQVRETIQILLMGGLSSAEIALRTNRKHDLELHPRTVDTYAHFFWNVGRAGKETWSKLLWGFYMRDHYMACLWGSKEQALYRAGFTPVIDGKVALKEAHRALAMRIEATRRFPDTKETVQMLTPMTKELVAVHGALFGEGAGVEEAMKELRRFNMKRSAKKVVALHEVAPNGNYSNSGKKD